MKELENSSLLDLQIKNQSLFRPTDLFDASDDKDDQFYLAEFSLELEKSTIREQPTLAAGDSS